MIKGATAVENLKDKYEKWKEVQEDTKIEVKGLIALLPQLRKGIEAANTAFTNGQINVGEYLQRLKDLKAGIYDLQEYINQFDMAEIEVEIEGMFDTTKNVTKEILKLYAGIEYEIKESTKKMKSFWDDLADGIQTKMATTFSDILKAMKINAETLKEIWIGIRDTIFDLIGQMAAKWLIGFIEKIITSSAEAGAAIAKNVGGSLAAGAKDVAGGIAKVAKGFGAVVDIASGIITAVASVANLFKKTGIGTTAEWHLQEIWKNTKELRDFVFIDVRKHMIQEAAKMRQVMINYLWRLVVYLEKVQPKQIKAQTTDLLKKLSQIRNDTKAMARSLSNMGGLQHGGIQWTPAFKKVAETGPELYTPLNKVGEVFGKMGGPTINIEYAPQITALDSTDVERFMFGPGIESLKKAIQDNVGGITREIKTQTDNMGE